MATGVLLNRFVQTLDLFLSRVQVQLSERRGGLISLFLHNVFTDAAEVECDIAYPQQGLTGAHLQQMIEYFQSEGHRFVSGDEVIAGLPPQGRYVMLSFDDGYFNNQRVLPLLEKHQVPALFYVPAQLVAERRAYWWDVLYRARRREGRSRLETYAEIARRMVAPTEDIEARLSQELGIENFKPVGDTDRLFTPEELCTFARHPLVRVGNHGMVHEHLTSYPMAEAAERINGAQKLLREMTGQTPTAIAYPYGAFSDEIVRISLAAGLKLGVTTALRKEYVTLLSQEDRRMRVGRFTVWGDFNIARQCCFMRGDLMLTPRYRQLVEKLKRSLA